LEDKWASLPLLPLRLPLWLLVAVLPLKKPLKRIHRRAERRWCQQNQRD
jgi:hypothetical protein